MIPSSHLSKLYQGQKLSLLTDLYQLTMAQGYWKNGMADREAVFHLYFRKAPFGGHYALACGLALAADFLQQFHFGVNEIQYLGTLRGSDGKALFSESFLNFLQRMEFTCDIDAIPEGTVVFPNTPLIRVRGPLVQAQLIETALLTLVNFSTLIATKASRVVRAAQGDAVLEFGLRRAQGADGGVSASRAAYIGGCTGTSNVLAGLLFRIPVKGTHAHSWVMCYDSELESFEAYANAMPNNCIFLVDTYDTEQGVRHAIKVSRQLLEKGYQPLGIRLDSGDLTALSKLARELLDEAGLADLAIVASNDLNEHRIAALKESGAEISVWGVGTQLATAYDQAALGGVYKLAALKDRDGQWQDKVKLSEDAIKTSIPGLQQVQRYFHESGQPLGDQIIDEKITNTPHQIIPTLTDQRQHINGGQAENLLQAIFRSGKLVYNFPSIYDIRAFSIRQQALFQQIELANYPVGLSPELDQRRKMLIKQHAHA
ncbi:MAG: nicotinate phosphoribosyltransferase [Bacteroidota bacterium]